MAKGSILIVIVSLISAYIRAFLPFETNSNIEGINEGIQANILRILLPLLLSPILEEWIFRKWIPNTFQEVMERKKVIILSNLIFTMLHLDIYFFPYLINGLIYSWYYEKMKDLRVPIIMHITYNLFVFFITI